MRMQSMMGHHHHFPTIARRREQPIEGPARLAVQPDCIPHRDPPRAGGNSHLDPFRPLPGCLCFINCGRRS
jgi:hypothetical protein